MGKTVKNFSKPRVVQEFSKYPYEGEEVIIETEEGIFKARYQRWDWSDSSETPGFQLESGRFVDPISWWYEDPEYERKRDEKWAKAAERNKESFNKAQHALSEALKKTAEDVVAPFFTRRLK